MWSEPAVSVNHVSKEYKLGLSGRTKSFAQIIRERLFHPIRGGQRRERLMALDDVSFELAHGDVLGIIGPNGAGKSTLLKILSRITPPTTGYIDIAGTVGSLLEIGTGFHPELTGLENVYLNGTILGMTRRDIDRRLDEIIDFSGVGGFLATPVKRYSSGMRVRLAFSVAAHFEPDIMIVDEVLSVGDFSFQAKCLDRMRAIAANEGRTIMYVSHQMVTVENLCPRSILMIDGRVMFDGPTRQTMAKYLHQLPRGEGLMAGVFDLSAGDRSSGEYDSILKRLEFKPSGATASDVVRMGERVRIEITLEDFNAFQEPYVFVTIGSAATMCLFRMTSRMKPLVAPGPRQSREKIAIEIPAIPLTPGEYFMDVQLKDGTKTVDFVGHAAEFNVVAADVFGNGHRFDSQAGYDEGYFVVPWDWEILPAGSDLLSANLLRSDMGLGATRLTS